MGRYTIPDNRPSLKEQEKRHDNMRARNREEGPTRMAQGIKATASHVLSCWMPV